MIPMKHRNSGFTLLEILIVLAIIGIVAALGAPVYFRYIYTQELVQSQQILIQQINAGRTGARKNSQTYWVEWQNNTSGGTVDTTRKFDTTTAYTAGVDTLKSLNISKNVQLLGQTINSTTGASTPITRVTYTPPYGRSDVINTVFTLTHVNLPGVIYTVRVMGVMGKVIRVEKF